jgi:hypothetical protein
MLFKDRYLSVCFRHRKSKAIRHIVREITVSKSIFKSTVIEALEAKITLLKMIRIYFKLFKASDMSHCFRYEQFKAIRLVASNIS